MEIASHVREAKISLREAALAQGVDYMDRRYADTLDAEDSLASYRNEFIMDDETIYLSGNSLGPMPKLARKKVEQQMDSWGERRALGYFAGDVPFVNCDDTCRKSMADIVGAKESEVVTMGALTENLNLLLVSFYRPKEEKFKVLMERKSFPSDVYAVESNIRFHGYDPRDGIIFVEPRANSYVIDTADVIKAIEDHKDELALILLPGIQFYTGQVLDMEVLSKTARDNRVTFGLDLAHAVGNIRLQMHNWKVDFAVWCTYKYLNAGPGNIGGAFIHEMHHNDDSIPKLQGWFSHKLSTRFEMSNIMDCCPDANAWRISNTNPLSIAALIAGIQVIESAGMEQIIRKSHKMTGYMEDLLAGILNDAGVSPVTVITPDERGAQLSILFDEDVVKVHDALQAAKIVCDVRNPGVIRVAPAPLYTRYVDVWNFVDTIRSILKR